MVEISGKNSMLFWNMRSGSVTNIHPFLPSTIWIERLRNIGHSMSIGNLIWGVNSVMVYLIHYDSLSQNATDVITKCNSYFVTKWDKVYYKMCQIFLLQNVIVLLQNATVNTKCDVYCKLQQYTRHDVLFGHLSSASILWWKTLQGFFFYKDVKVQMPKLFT